MVKKPVHNKTIHLLSSYIQLKTGKTLPILAKELQVKYHSLTKTVQKSQCCGNTEIKKKVAAYLNILYDDLWGPESDTKIKVLIQQELVKSTVKYSLDFYNDLRERILGGT